MPYNFDEIIDRRNTNSLKHEGFRQYVLHDDGTMQFPCGDDELVRMWVADQEFAAPEAVIDAMRRCLDRRIFGYSRPFDPGYYEAFAGWCDRHYGWHAERRHLVTANGVVPAICELTGYITKPGQKVLSLAPSYPDFKVAADLNGRGFVTSPLVRDAEGRFSIDFDDLERKAADPLVKLMILCHPHNPTGRDWTEAELRRVAEICERHGLWIISDEIHCDLLRKGGRHTPLAKLFPGNDRIITCTAPSKTFNLAGLMIANIVIPNEELRAVWNARHYSFDNPISLAGTQAAYEKGDEWLEALKDYLDRNFRFTADFLAENLPLAKFRIPEATYLAWVDASAYLKGVADVTRFFAEHAGVLLEGGGMFTDSAAGFIRLNIACPRSMLEKALRRIHEALRERA
ncbi:MalY/PatB family protein [Sutterella sp.]|uniref:MalY/PatB family protein n=1 Tax=Sutterella sp. TaxID=1981025 RepID=UPI0026E0B934|nr:MalY/PatB family protein [Sutterella sp.]MDO5532440.1 MalY/PatB family protein [Sutterella sp.]